MTQEYYLDDYDYLRLCSVCGDCYTTGDLCDSCRRQEMIDNDDLSWMDAPAAGATEEDDEHDEPGYHTDDDPLIDFDHPEAN